MLPNEFPPARQKGLIVHFVLIAMLAIILVIAVGQVFQSEVGPTFTIYFLLALATFFPLPFLGYRAYALLRANYTLDRETIQIIWGLRLEEIPVSDVEWVRSAHDLLFPLPLPFIRLPGSVLGARRHPDLGVVEFLASDANNLLLVATARQVFAISPADPAGFVNTFQRTIELGALSPGEASSQYPSSVVAQAWKYLLVRYLWIASLFLNIGLFIWVTILIPSLQQVPLGFTGTLAPLVVPGARLILLPLLSGLLYLLSLLSGLYFFRWEEYRVLAFILWISGALSAFLFLISVLFLLTTPF
jgi:hypothetical protein